MATMKAPPAIQGVYEATKKLVPATVLLGITGDARHVSDGGYHISRSLLEANGMRGDYSIQHANDRMGDPDNSSAIDLGFGGYGVPLVKAVGQRMLAAGRNRDPRVACLREFYCCGPSDSGSDVIGWDFEAHAPAYTSDLSHRGHLHMSFIREFSNDPQALAGIASVIAGHPIQQEVEDDMAVADQNAINAHTDKAIAAAVATLEAKLATAVTTIDVFTNKLDSIIIHGDAQHPNSLDSEAAALHADTPKAA